MCTPHINALSRSSFAGAGIRTVLESAPDALSNISRSVSATCDDNTANSTSSCLNTPCIAAAAAEPYSWTISISGLSFCSGFAATPFVAEMPPAYPNHVYLGQCGPRRRRTKSSKPIQLRHMPAHARQPYFMKTSEPTAVPATMKESAQIVESA
jgi:hypothetical protein